MDFLTSGFEELDRKYARTVVRCRIFIERRKLTKAEINLGLLGWQQADFPPEVEEQIQAINTVELQQAELSNRSAEIQWNLGELKTQLDQVRADHHESNSALKSTLEPLLESRTRAERSIVRHQEGIKRFEEAGASLEIESESLRAQYEGMLAIEPQTLHLKEMILRVSDKRSVLENSKEDLLRARMNLHSEMKAMWDHIGEMNAQIEEMNQRISEEEEQFAAREKDLLSQIDALQGERKAALKHVDTLDKKKAPAYLAIGRCLADFNIEPMNQPDALTGVLEHRESVEGFRQLVEASLAVSSQVNRGTLTMFYVVMILFIVAVIVGLIVLCTGGIHHR